MLRSRTKRMRWPPGPCAPMFRAMDTIDRTASTVTASASARRAQPRFAAVFPVVLITACLGAFLAQIDTSVVNLALKRIGGELGSSVTQLQWVLDAYNLAYAAFLLTGGALGDTFGRRRVFMIGIGLFTAGSLICGIAPDNAMLLAGRTLTGLGAALLV